MLQGMFKKFNCICNPFIIEFMLREDSFDVIENLS